MNLKRHDAWATTFVFGALALWVLWWTDTAFEGLSTRIVGTVVFALGFAACMSDQQEMPAVFGVGNERRVSRAYLVVASLLGVVALGAGVITMIGGSATWLAVLVITTSLLWAISTLRHALAPAEAPLRRDDRIESTGTLPTAV